MRQGLGPVLRLKENIIVKWPTLVAEKEEEETYTATYRNYTNSLYKTKHTDFYWRKSLLIRVQSSAP